ncbi:hypothetical protein [Catellatospora paridis]|uniref:hypothetical protein n=1 Tax=Catellatospora paridis TaxID=1617086 RepID=UPI0012D398B0|nr:hypothetical protein [Catellatospora paridis]
MTEPSPVRSSWLRETMTLLRLCWRPLLVIGIVTELAYLRRADLPASPAAEPAPEALEPVVIELGRAR